jgi:hypothetical protein
VLASKEREQLLLVRVLPYLDEVALPCGVPKTHEDFTRYEAAFNDLSVHRFPPELLDRALRDDADLSEQMAAVTSATELPSDEAKPAPPSAPNEACMSKPPRVTKPLIPKHVLPERVSSGV